jgi:periplasmic mercuric ion binding protein
LDKKGIFVIQTQNKIHFMKYLILLFGLFFFSQTSLAQAKKNEKAVIKTTIYCDHCNECETCGQNFNSNIYKIKGFKMYELDAENKTITVYYNSKKTDLQTIKIAISKLGYDADDVKADAIAYQNLDDCCKKE